MNAVPYLTLNLLKKGALQGVMALLLAPGLGAQAVLTWHNDAARTGQNLGETILTPANVNSTNFGLKFKLSVDGQVDAQPLYVPLLSIGGATHNVVYIATENDTLYAFDADTGAQLWSQSVADGENPSDDRGCGQVTPQIGVTSTPAIDLTSGPHGTIYLVAMTKDNSNNYHQRLHAIDLVTHAEEFGGPMEVQATYPKTSGVTTFDSKQYKDRAGLLILNGVVYTSWASHCDINPYTAWLIGYNESTLSRVSVLNMTPNGSEGSIWQAGAGPAADSNSNVYFLLANGTFDTTLNGAGLPSKGDYGNAFMNISTSSGLAVADYFTMYNTTNESNNDEDLGSGGAMVLPTLNDALGHPHPLAVGAGKDGNAYVVDRSNMGKFNKNNDSAIYQQFGLGGSVFSSPAWFNNTLYYGPVGSQLSAYPYSGGSFGAASSQTSTNFTYPGTTPSISANGSVNGIVWAMENSSPAVLHAYDATNLANELYNSNQAANSRDQFGVGNKFMTPTIAHGKVFAAATSSDNSTNVVGVFGLLKTTPPGDFNLDGHVDLLWQNSSSGLIAMWYLGGTQGNQYQSWAEASNAPAGWNLICAADFNGDGHPDLVLQNTSTGQVVVWYMGGAAGNTYESWAWLSIEGPAGWTLVAAIDMNGDGHPDLIWENASTRQVVVWYMGGSQGNVYQSWATAGLSPGWTLAAVADVNSDGHPDLIWQNDTTRQVAVWYMGGSGGNVYQSWAWLDPVGQTGWTVVGDADINLDGTPDLIWQNDTSGQVVVWYMGGSQGNVYSSWSGIGGSVPGWRAIARY